MSDENWKAVLVKEAAKQGPSFVVLVMILGLLAGGVYWGLPKVTTAAKENNEVIRDLTIQVKDTGEKVTKNLDHQNKVLDSQNVILKSIKLDIERTRKAIE